MEIFISYRRSDSAEFSARIYQKLVAVLGEDCVFQDIQNILAGRDFQFALDSITKNCSVMLVIIGPDWMRIMKERATSSEDWVRFEVETGLNRKDILVIPVLAMGAAMPAGGDLPPTIQDLSKRNAVQVRDMECFDGDMENLITVINKFGYKRIPGSVSNSFFLYADSNRDAKIIARVKPDTAIIFLEKNRDGTWSHLLLDKNVDGWANNEDFKLVTTQHSAYDLKQIELDKGFGAKSGPWQLFFTAPTGERMSDGIYGIDVRLADAISRCKSTLDVAAFEFNNNVLTDELISAYKRGIRVRMVTEQNSLIDREKYTYEQLAQAGIPIIPNNRTSLMHNKFMILDGKTVWTGSWNYSENSTYRNNENTLVFDAPEIAGLYKSRFEEMFSEGKFGSRATRNGYHTLTISGIPVEICFTPNETIGLRLQELIQIAKKSIHYMMFSFTNHRLGDSMIQAFQAGAKVFGIQERIGAISPYGTLTTLVKAGLDIRLDNNPYFLHHKVIVLDEAIVITGSMNLTNNALENNDENVLIIHDPVLATVYLEEFYRLWKNAKTPNL